MRFVPRLETVSLDVPHEGVEWYERALAGSCASVGLFLDEATNLWRIEGVRQAGRGGAELQASLLLAELQTGIAARPSIETVPADGWLARNRQAFPEQIVGHRFIIRGTHLDASPPPGRIGLILDASVAFGSGEHASTQGCLLALENIAYRHPRRILDLGTGSGVLAMAASRLLFCKATAVDNDPWSVRIARQNARRNRLHTRIDVALSDGWKTSRVRARGPYDLVFANILARPLCAMAASLARNLADHGTAILAGLLVTQARQVIAAHRRVGLRLEDVLRIGPWATLILRQSSRRSKWTAC